MPTPVAPKIVSTDTTKRLIVVSDPGRNLPITIGPSPVTGLTTSLTITQPVPVVGAKSVTESGDGDTFTIAY